MYNLTHLIWRQNFRIKSCDTKSNMITCSFQPINPTIKLMQIHRMRMFCWPIHNRKNTKNPCTLFFIH
ncbi:hypothetical protein HanRHA438_Chr09g0426341 [Helianthus annuus]|nr:hypothetical protein HanRHA438_Chr09g0426341 [Helianthus annuus]